MNTCMQDLARDGFFLYSEHNNSLTRRCKTYLKNCIADYNANNIRHLNLETLEGEIDIHTLAVDGRCTDPGFEPFFKQLWNPLWCDILRPMCIKRLHLAKAELHLHNIMTDGPVHRDEDRCRLRIWNVAVPLHSNQDAGATMVYSDAAVEDRLHNFSATRLNCEENQFYIFDANLLHFRRRAMNEYAARERCTLMLSFTDGDLPNNVAFIA